MLATNYSVETNNLGKKKLKVTFEIENGKILSDFMMYEVVCFESEIKSMFDEVLVKNTPLVEKGFNFCDLIIDAYNTVVIDSNHEDELQCCVNTRELYFLILDWCEKYHEFESQK